MSDLDRAREALEKAAIRRFNADQRWERERLKSYTVHLALSKAYYKAADAMDAAADAYTRAHARAKRRKVTRGK